VAFNGVTWHTPWRRALEVFAVGFLFASCIGPLCAIVIPRIAPRLCSRLRFPLDWAILIAVMIGLGAVGSLLAILVLAVAGFLFRSRFLKPPARLATAPSAASLAILPFHNASGDPDLDWLGSSLGEMLTTDVGYSPGLRTVSSDRVSQVLGDERVPPGSAIDASLMPRLAELSRAETVVWGQYAKSGEQIRIDATLQDVKHQRRLTLMAEASGQEDLLPTVDRLARSVRENLALSPQLVKELQEQAFRPSTSSLVALHSYDQGVELFRHGHSSEALKRFQNSVKADSHFALAYSKLGKTYASLGYDKQAEQAARKATDLSGGLPTREKDLISANEASIINDKTTAIQAYEKLIKTSPDDTDVLFDLAALYSSAGSFRETLETKVMKNLAHPQTNLGTLNNVGGRAGVEIKNNHCG